MEFFANASSEKTKSFSLDMLIRPPFDSWFLNLPEPYRFLAQKASQKQSNHAETRTSNHPSILGLSLGIKLQRRAPSGEMFIMPCTEASLYRQSKKQPFNG